jgi:uncharacterized protein (DUF433 family)
MNWKEHITSEKDILLGKPAIKGTRLSVEHIVSLFAQGWDEEKILANYPRLTKENLIAVFAFLQDCIKDGLFYTPTKAA